MIQVDSRGQNSIVLDSGGNRLWRREEISIILSHFSPGDVIVLQNEINDIPYIISEAKRHGMLVVLNPSPFDCLISTFPLSDVDLFFVNEIEGKALTGKDDFADILCEFGRIYKSASIVLTCGKKGAYAKDGDQVHYQEIIDYPVVDTTGAGDTFTGYYLASVFSGMGIEKALYRATEASAIAVSRSGAMAAIPAASELSS